MLFRSLFFSFLVLSALLLSLPKIPLSAPAFFLSYLSPRTLFFFFCALLISRSGSTALIAFLSPAGNLANACAILACCALSLFAALSFGAR